MPENFGNWTTEQVGGHPVDVFEPTKPSVHNYSVIYLHGVHLNRIDQQRPFVDEFERHGLRVVVPWTARSWWTDRICAEFDPHVSAEQHVINRILPWIAARFDARPTQIGLLGTSMGGQGALRFGFKYPQLFPVIAAISPAIDYHLRMREGDETLEQMYADPEAARQDTVILHVHPLNWPRQLWFCCDPIDYRWHESADRLRMKLAALGIPFTADLDTTGGGHGFEYYNRMAKPAVGFIAEALERERRRVP
jgi:S-formylglutathione hydrolase FrmB